LRDTPPWDWPSQTSERLLQVLTQPHTTLSDRLVAAELASDYTVVNEELAQALLAVARHTEEPTALRARAALSLGPVLEQADTGGFENPEEVSITEPTFRQIQNTLQTLYQDPRVPQELQRRVLEASVRAPQPWHAEALREAYACGDLEWKLTAVFAMRWVSGFREQILEALASPDPAIRCEALEAAGNWELEEAGPQVAFLLQDGTTPKAVLLSAIGAASAIRPAEAESLLLPLTEAEDEEIAEAAEEAMAFCGEDPGEMDDEEWNWLR
jgi:HEAT repeat protein